MSKTTNIFLILLTCISLSACQEDDFGSGAAPDMATLIAQGKYLTARNAETFAAQVDPEKGAWFPDGTPFRLLAFTKPYQKDNDYEKDPTAYNYAKTIRFNEVTWEGETKTSFGDIVRYININGDPDKMFGFKALTSADGSLSDEVGNDTSLVALDFYGFTYGKKAAHNDNYIPLDPIDGITSLAETGNETPTDNSILEELKRTETVSDDGISLNDLMRGQLLNCDILPDKNEVEDVATQSIIPFKHCFSHLQFMVVQEPKDEKPNEGGEIEFNNHGDPSFKDLYVENVTVTGTYGSGAVYLKDGKVELSKPIDRPLQFNSEYKGPVTTQQVYLGDMIIFPSDGNYLKNTELAEGYTLGLEITVRCPEEKTLKNFIRNTSGHEPLENEIETVATGNNETYYRCTVKKEKILNSNYEETVEKNEDGTTVTKTEIKPLYLKQNTNYTLVIAFQQEAVRIITVVPLVEEWLPGEGTTEDPWQDQALGQPQMFDNIVWSDRNLGADHYDATGADFERTLGYFYQAGRNIPYFPFKFKDYKNGTYPTLKQLKNQTDFADTDTRWHNENYRFYPVVDDAIINIGNYDWWVITRAGENPKNPQMFIPESKPVDKYFDFMVDKTLWDDDMEWNKGVDRQPTTGAWSIPTSAQYMSIFPSTPHAGNITFRTGDTNDGPMQWCEANDPGINDTKTLRVTVPYYKPESSDNDKPISKSAAYQQAWQTLHDNKDAGTTHIDQYTSGPDDNISYEPDGDPEDGYASIYVISKERKDIDVVSLTPGKMTNLYIREWGTIYGIKRVYTSEAYRMRWRALIAKEGTYSPCIYIELCRYRCKPTDTLDETTYKEYDWDHPAARIYFPVCGLGDYPGQYINFGTECQYATSDPIVNGVTSAVQIKITGDNASNAYIAIVKNNIDRHFGMQIRPIVGGGKITVNE